MQSTTPSTWQDIVNTAVAGASTRKSTWQDIANAVVAGASKKDSPPRGSSWMQDNLSWLKEYPIKDVLIIPGSHNAGMVKSVEPSSQATDDNVLTQTQSVYGQLQSGARWFDIRPMALGSEYFCGRFTKANRVGWQGGYGEKIDDVIEDVNRFTRQNKELVVLRVTHVADGANGNVLSFDQQTTIMRMFYDRLEHVRKADKEEWVLDEKLDKYVGTNQCVIIATRADSSDGPIVDEKVCPAIGRSITNYDQDIVSCCYIPDDLAAGLTSSTLAILRSSLDGRFSILKGSDILQGKAFPTAPQTLVVSTGGTSPKGKGVIYQTDNIKDDAQMSMCIAASRVQWATNKNGNKGGQVIAVYGGKLIEDRKVLDNIGSKIAANQSFKCDGSLFGISDSWWGSRKSCCIFWSESREPRSGDGLLWRGIFGREGDEMDWNTQILQICWHNQYLKGDEFRQAYAAFITAKIARLPLKLEINAMPFLRPDPAPGQRKQIILQYKSMSARLTKERNIWEDRTYNLASDIDWIKWHDCIIQNPSSYRRFFDRIDGENRAGVLVSNDLFGWDPAVGKLKMASMSWQQQLGHDGEIWKRDTWRHEDEEWYF